MICKYTAGAVLALGCALLDAATAAEGDAALASVTVLGHYDNAIGTTDAASQGTVTANLIANRPALRTGELLEFVPGMIVTQHSGDGKANQYFLRGFNLDHGTDFATWVDGVPVNMRSNAHGQGYSDLNFLIPELVQRIDYKKGSYFADEGDFSSAGAAHIRLSDQLKQGIASLTVGSYGYQRGVLADSFAAADGTLLYGLELSRNNGPWQTPEQVRKYSATLRYSHGDAQNGYSITAMAYRNRWNATDQVPLRAVQSGLIDRFGGIDPSDGGDTARTSLAWNMHRRDSDRITEASAYLLHSSLELYSNFTYLLNDPVNGDQFQQSERRTVGGASASQAWLSQIGGIDMRNKLGVETRYDHIAPIGLYATAARQRLSTVREDRVDEASLGLYAENTSYWTPSLRSIAGLRYDAYRFKVNDDRASAHKFSPKLSLIFGPWRDTEYFINYGAGFHSNDARGVTGPAPAPPLVGTRGAELGVRSSWLPGLQSSFSLWALDIDSELVYAGDSGQTEASRASRRTGVEWSNHYIAAPWLLFDLDLSASRARYRDSDPAGNYVPEALNKVASFGVTVKDIGRWFGGLELRYFGQRPLMEDNSVRSAATTLAYGRIGYQLNRRTRLTLDGFNLFNRRASDIDYLYTSRLAGEPAEGVSDVHFHPVEPRTLRLTLSHNF
ncbi:Outer membrane receptor proteins, mostly Fe transport [Duganella sacchari]|uniref:Outer membrane receptor proteins, mostly Fe transport n=1 Tax=Duganella sacchari TaxID=551987 RepID=A0A1M7MLI4_9BURK|nr:TonB-dependent receptor [Duganella sacchari]SHM91893.1 Outer membrane receptor proteins, mostly Fe transport [Duganella sacchari]